MTAGVIFQYDPRKSDDPNEGCCATVKDPVGGKIAKEKGSSSDHRGVRLKPSVVIRWRHKCFRQEAKNQRNSYGHKIMR